MFSTLKHNLWIPIVPEPQRSHVLINNVSMDPFVRLVPATFSGLLHLGEKYMFRVIAHIIRQYSGTTLHQPFQRNHEHCDWQCLKINSLIIQPSQYNKSTQTTNHKLG
ncbi:hypothetical protein AMECASPLE_033252 [Ameca splendens]|uniref:Uncharacterized protein n=1 Tax=Ameca splendens TaxID=208324 RepID=A0ABV0XVL4_9TELE